MLQQVDVVPQLLMLLFDKGYLAIGCSGEVIVHHLIFYQGFVLDEVFSETLLFLLGESLEIF
jgi:hypothetical protein